MAVLEALRSFFYDPERTFPLRRGRAWAQGGGGGGGFLTAPAWRVATATRRPRRRRPDSKQQLKRHKTHFNTICCAAGW